MHVRGRLRALPTQLLVPGNVLGAMFVTALVFFGVLSASRWFNFDTIYQLAFPLFIVGFLFVMPTFGRTRKSWRCATMRATPCCPCTS
mgnify:FL=1